MKIASHTKDYLTARTWFEYRLAELTRRVHGFFSRLAGPQHEEAVADTLARIFHYVVGAQARRKLHRLTPASLVRFFGTSYYAGRRAAGSNSRDMMSEVTRDRRRPRVMSLDQPRWNQNGLNDAATSLSKVLEDRRENSPLENVRKALDFPAILQKERVGFNGRRVFHYLCQTHGQGSHRQLARELGVSPTRITQIKRELGACLAKNGYGPPATRSRTAAMRR